MRVRSGRHHIPIVVTNQVTDVVSHRDYGEGHLVEASLGASWSQCLITRLALRRVDGAAVAVRGKRVHAELVAAATVADDDRDGVTKRACVEDSRRRLMICFSSHLPSNIELAVSIESDGLFAAI